MKVTVKSNENTINKLQEGYNSCWDLFMYGDKKRNIKPGSIQVYGAIKGIEEVSVQREIIQEKLEAAQQEELNS